MTTFPIITLADGVTSDPQWFADITDVANNHETRISTLEGIDLTPLWTVSSTTATAGTTVTEVVFATAPSSTYRRHTAYRIEISGYGRRTDAAPATNQSLQVRDTNAAGTIRMGPLTYIVNPGAVISNLPIQLFHYVANTTGSDILGRVLVATQFNSGGTTVLNASATKPWYVTCIAVGLDTDFPQSVAL